MPAHPALSVPATLRVRDITHSLGGQTILHAVSVTVGPDACLGVVGRNGAGKSTLLGIMAGLVVPDAGSVDRLPPSATVGYLAQEHARSKAETVAAHLQRVTGVGAAENDFQAAIEALTRQSPGSDDRYAEALERWTALGAPDFDTRQGTMLTELELPSRVLNLPTAALSGGQMARVALAGILLSRFDVLLLDEPTNDLDFAGLEHLEDFVRSRHQATVLVSHDREFLDRTIGSVLELDDHSREGRLYRGGWSSYLAERDTDRRQAEEAYARYEERRRNLRERAQRERQWAVSGVSQEKDNPRDDDKLQRKFRVERTEQLASRARRTERALERLTTVVKPWQGWDLRFEIEEAARAGAVVARLEKAVIERGSFRLGPIDLEIAWGDRIWLSGPNGSGKTTLLSALLGHLPLASGRRWVGPSVVVGELGQLRGRWATDEPLIRAFLDESGMVEPEGRSLLAKFGLGAARVHRAVGSLSPGERTRAELARFQATGVNLLVLDEPTNHLDLPAVEELESALEGFTGTLVLVTHDRRLLGSLNLTREVNVADRAARGQSPSPGWV